MLVVGVLQGPNGTWYGTSNKTVPNIVCAGSSYVCLHELLFSIRWDFNDGGEAVLIRIFPWDKHEVAVDLFPDSVSKTIMTAIERSHHVSKDSV